MQDLEEIYENMSKIGVASGNSYDFNSKMFIFYFLEITYDVKSLNMLIIKYKDLWFALKIL